MRPELLEYGYDDLLRRSFKLSTGVLDATPKEMDYIFKAMPDFKGPFDLVGSVGEGGKFLFQAMESWMNDIVTAHDRGKKLVLTTFCYPVGILRAFGCVALNMEIMTAFGNALWARGVYDFYDHCTELGMTETSCAGQRGAMGAYLAGAGETPDFVLINSPGFCDSNANSFQFYSALRDIPIYAHDCPPDLTGERAKAYHHQDFRNMMVFMEEQTGQKLDWDILREVAQEIKKQDLLVDEIITLMQHVPSPVPSFSTIAMTAVKLAFSGFAEATPVLEEIVRISKENLKKGIAGTPSGKEKLRVFPCYIDHYTQGLNFWTFLNQNSFTHLGSILDYYWNEGCPYDKGFADETYSIDLTSEDSIIDSLADQLARMPMVKQIIGPYNDKTQWLEDTLNAAKLYQADCAVYIGTLGCRNTWAMVKPFAADLEAAGIPSYILFADAFDDRVTSWENCELKLMEFFKLRKLIS